MKNQLIAKLFVTAALASGFVAAQNLTPAQKEADFRYLASLYATYYAPLAWKAQAAGFNAADLKPWLDRVAQTASDLDFYEVCVDYIAALKDSHVWLQLPSDFTARLGITADIYDGRPLIDVIDRSLLPSSRYPFAIGDELVSVDGEDALALAGRFMKYSPQGNPRASLRLAAARITIRNQWTMPHAPDVGASATVVIRRQSGALETYTIPWNKSGTPLTVGPVPNLRSARTMQQQAAAFADPLDELRFSGVLNPALLEGVIGFGARNPIFQAALTPPLFTRRLGGSSADFFYSGVFQFDGLRIGYIRIPNYSPPSQTTALAQFDNEIAYMNANTDGLVVDEMRNTGGLLCFGETLASRLTPYEFQATGFDIRPFWSRVLGFYNTMISAKSSGLPWDVVAQYEANFNEMLAANREGRLLANNLPLCSSSLTRAPARDANGNIFAYQKRVMVLVDELSMSTADSFAAMMQDSGRAVLYGTRSNGAGGNNTYYPAGNYTEALVGMTLALQVRPQTIATGEFPASRYIENVGVRPDVENDYMTKENLLGGGAKFVEQFLQGMAAYIRQ